MTKKDFEAIAAIVKAQPPSFQRWKLAQSLADFCAERNPNFRLGTFMEACDEAS